MNPPKPKVRTCDGCGRRRQCEKPENRTMEVMHHPDGRKKLLTPSEHKEAFNLLIHFYWLCSECLPKVKTQADIAALRKAREPKMRAKVAYPILGGPLDGQSAITDDMYSDGMYAAVAREYVEYNSAGAGGKRIGSNPPSMLWIHRSLLRPIIAGRDR